MSTSQTTHCLINIAGGTQKNPWYHKKHAIISRFVTMKNYACNNGGDCGRSGERGS